MLVLHQEIINYLLEINSNSGIVLSILQIYLAATVSNNFKKCVEIVKWKLNMVFNKFYF
jgi:hypothetical protein